MRIQTNYFFFEIMDNYLEQVAYLKHDPWVRRKKKKNFARQPSNLKAISRLAEIVVSRLNNQSGNVNESN